MKEYQQKERVMAAKITRIEIASGPDSFRGVLIVEDGEHIDISKALCRREWHNIEAGSYYVVSGEEAVIVSAEVFERDWEPLSNKVPDASLIERLRIHAADKSNTAFSRSTMNEILELFTGESK
jgi:hypothetical protein